MSLLYFAMDDRLFKVVFLLALAHTYSAAFLSCFLGLLNVLLHALDAATDFLHVPQMLIKNKKDFRDA